MTVSPAIPPTLRELFAKAETRRCVHMAIDVQEMFVHSGRIEDIVQKIGRVIAPSFSGLEIPTYWVYWPVNDKNFPANLDGLDVEELRSRGGYLYNVEPSAIDIVIPKSDSSALQNYGYDRNKPTLTKQKLTQDKPDIIFVSGFAYEECVRKTVLDLREMGYQVVLLEDGTDEPDDKSLREQELVDAGVVFARSEHATEAIKLFQAKGPTRFTFNS